MVKTLFQKWTFKPALPFKSSVGLYNKVYTPLYPTPSNYYCWLEVKINPFISAPSAARCRLSCEDRFLTLLTKNPGFLEVFGAFSCQLALFVPDTFIPYVLTCISEFSIFY